MCTPHTGRAWNYANNYGTEFRRETTFYGCFCLHLREHRKICDEKQKKYEMYTSAQWKNNKLYEGNTFRSRRGWPTLGRICLHRLIDVWTKRKYELQHQQRIANLMHMNVTCLLFFRGILLIFNRFFSAHKVLSNIHWHCCTDDKHSLAFDKSFYFRHNFITFANLN